MADIKTNRESNKDHIKNINEIVIKIMSIKKMARLKIRGYSARTLVWFSSENRDSNIINFSKKNVKKYMLDTRLINSFILTYFK